MTWGCGKRLKITPASAEVEEIVRPSQHVGHLCTEKNDLRRVVDPNQKHDDRRSRTIGQLQPLRSDVPTDGEFEEKRGRHASSERVLPPDVGVGKPFEKHGEQNCEDAKGNKEVDRLPEEAFAAPKPGREGAEYRADDERDREQEPEPENTRERNQVRPKVPPNASTSGSLVSQIVLSASLSWTTTPSAAIRSRTMPTMPERSPASRACPFEHRFDGQAACGT